jgi:hypothetical protein
LLSIIPSARSVTPNSALALGIHLCAEMHYEKGHLHRIGPADGKTRSPRQRQTALRRPSAPPARLLPQVAGGPLTKSARPDRLRPCTMLAAVA